MKSYDELLKKYTEEILPKAFEEATKLEKKTELLLYYMMSECLSNLESVMILLTKGDPMIKVLKAWRDDEKNSFGTNAFSLNELSNGDIILMIKYDIYKITEDIETMSSDMFGNINFDKTGEKVLSKDVMFEENEIVNLFDLVEPAIKKLQLSNEEND